LKNFEVAVKILISVSHFSLVSLQSLMKRKDLLINKLEKPLILSKTMDFLKKIKTDDPVTENMEVYDDTSGQVLIEMDLHLGIFDVQNSEMRDEQGQLIPQHSLHSQSDDLETSNESDSSQSDTLSHSDDESEGDYSSDEEQVKLIEEVE
jgi:hypothetical protein